MAIISKETWEKFTQEEKEKLQKIYKELKEDPSLAYASEYAEKCNWLEEYFGKENFQPKLKEYWEIEEELFNHKANQWVSYYIRDKYNTGTQIVKSDCTSRKQAEKLLAINKLLNVAKFLNKDWKPDWENINELKYGIGIYNGNIKIEPVAIYNLSIVYFRTEELAKQAIQILGEDTVRLVLSSDF